MKADERKRLERNELASRLHDYWSGVNSASPRTTRLWTVALICFILVVGWFIYSRYTSNQTALAWSQLDFAVDTDGLRKVVEDEPHTVPAVVAKMQLARAQVQDAVNKLAAPNPDDRVAAAIT